MKKKTPFFKIFSVFYALISAQNLYAFGVFKGLALKLTALAHLAMPVLGPNEVLSQNPLENTLDYGALEHRHQGAHRDPRWLHLLQTHFKANWERFETPEERLNYVNEIFENFYQDPKNLEAQAWKEDVFVRLIQESVLPNLTFTLRNEESFNKLVSVVDHVTHRKQILNDLVLTSVLELGFAIEKELSEEVRSRRLGFDAIPVSVRMEVETFMISEDSDYPIRVAPESRVLHPNVQYELNKMAELYPYDFLKNAKRMHEKYSFSPEDLNQALERAMILVISSGDTNVKVSDYILPTMIDEEWFSYEKTLRRMIALQAEEEDQASFNR